MALRPWQVRGVAAAGCVVAGVFIAEAASPAPPPFETTLSQEVAGSMRTGHAIEAGKILVVKVTQPNQALLMADLQIGWTRMGSADLLPPDQRGNAAMWCGTDVESGGASDKASIAYLGAMAEHGNGTDGSPNDQFKRASDLCMAQVLSRMEHGHTITIPVSSANS